MRLIDADAIPFAQSENGVLDDYAYRYDINELPTIEAEPVKHGRWIMGTGENGLQTGHRKCSRCGEIVKYGYSLYGVHNFCNYCGAKMDLEVDHAKE